MKNIVRRAGAVAAMLALVALCGCGMQRHSEPFVGTWELIETTGGDSALSLDDVSEMRDLGMVIQLELNEDGTLVIDQHGETSEGTWRAVSSGEGVATLDGEVASLTLDGDRLVMGDEESSMTFERHAAKHAA